MITKSLVCKSKGGKVLLLHLHLHGVEDHFHTFLCNMGSSLCFHYWGLACILGRSVPTLISLLYLHTPRGSRHGRDSHCFLSSKYPHIDCPNIRLREASKTASQRKISFVISRIAGISGRRNSLVLTTSRFGKSSAYLYNSRMSR
jgi:hypothetical protein